MEFILEDGMKIVVNKDENTMLIAELYNEEGEFLERSRFNPDDLYDMFF